VGVQDAEERRSSPQNTARRPVPRRPVASTGPHLPVNSGKLLVSVRRSYASRQRPLCTRSLNSGTLLPRGQPGGRGGGGGGVGWQHLSKRGTEGPTPRLPPLVHCSGAPGGRSQPRLGPRPLRSSTDPHHRPRQPPAQRPRTCGVLVAEGRAALHAARRLRVQQRLLGLGRHRGRHLAPVLQTLRLGPVRQRLAVVGQEAAALRGRGWR
jgi:hypothetical protein